MKFLTDIKELEGKTILKAVEVDNGESYVLIFDDDTCAFFDVHFFGDSHYMALLSKADDYLKWDAGIISSEEYTSIAEKKDKENDEINKQRDLKRLAELKDKYEG